MVPRGGRARSPSARAADEIGDFLNRGVGKIRAIDAHRHERRLSPVGRKDDHLGDRRRLEKAGGDVIAFVPRSDTMTMSGLR